MSIEIISLSESMAENVHNLECLCFPDPYSESVLRKDFANPSNICFCAVCCDILAGYCICSTVLDEAELQRIAVSDKFRGQGIASLMVDYLIEQCNFKGISRMYLEVRESNTPARRLYEKHNFIQTGIRKAYYRDNGENAVLYALSLSRR
ncbi:MAG: ribosomal protein S18-alanine N-acetyltransferase [Clostridia bacterium]|nr:ribosomal protein S18-alanine N-acetyltransferase [Clostridia bacterium]